MRLLQQMGYERVRHYAGGMEDWNDHAGDVETAERVVFPSVQAGATNAGRGMVAAPQGRGRVLASRLLEAVAERSIGQFLQIWLWMAFGLGLIFWLAGAWRGHGLRTSLGPLNFSLSSLADAIYFSFVTALSIGYGDIVPIGPLRLLAIVEGAAGLLIFGCVISKLVSRRQDELLGEIHRIAFEDRLGRVRTNLHIVLSELQTVSEMCTDATHPQERVLVRIESVATVFAGELQAIHDLLYRPQLVPEEEALASILSSLAAGFRELNDLLGCMPGGAHRSVILESNVRRMNALANEICGECVPRDYAPGLKAWMDKIQDLSRRMALL